MTFKLNHVHLKTKDPEQTAKFYVDTLGATIVGRAGNGGYRLDLEVACSWFRLFPLQCSAVRLAADGLGATLPGRQPQKHGG